MLKSLYNKKREISFAKVCLEISWLTLFGIPKRPFAALKKNGYLRSKTDAVRVVFPETYDFDLLLIWLGVVQVMLSFLVFVVTSLVFEDHLRVGILLFLSWLIARYPAALIGVAMAKRKDKVRFEKAEVCDFNESEGSE